MSRPSNLKSLALSDVYGRLVRLLNALAQDVDGRLVVPEKLTQQDIADRVGASRDMIGKLMKDLVGGGYLAVEDRTITILQEAAHRLVAPTKDRRKIGVRAVIFGGDPRRILRL